MACRDRADACPRIAGMSHASRCRALSAPDAGQAVRAPAGRRFRARSGSTDLGVRSVRWWPWRLPCDNRGPLERTLMVEDTETTLHALARACLDSDEVQAKLALTERVAHAFAAGDVPVETGDGPSVMPGHAE